MIKQLVHESFFQSGVMSSERAWYLKSVPNQVLFYGPDLKYKRPNVYKPAQISLATARGISETSHS